ncbi:MAG: CPBP family intramembrane metalloprotease [Clostridia bacterium]|nr:CPBP family intramembrane metalloprotease [Clostridia bacterium]
MKKTKILDGITAFVFAVIIILFVNALLFMKLGITGMAIAEILLIAAPLLLVLFRRENVSERFNLGLPSIGSFFSAVLLMLGANMWENAASFIYVAVFGMPEQNDMTFLESYFSDVSPIIVLVIIGIIPAVCEELLFRGYLFSSFKGKKSKVAAVIITSVLFSVIHFDMYKMVPIFIMALAFGYITAKTDSVLIPMIFHLVNNSMAVVSFYVLRGEETTAATEMISDKAYLWYAVAAFGMGLVLVYFGTRLLSGKPRKKVFNILVPILSGVLFTAGVIGLMLSMMSMPYVGTYSAKLREDTVYTESFTLEENGMGVISAQTICSNKVVYSVTITDAEGDEVYNCADPQSGNGVYMEKGEYTVTYSFDIPEGENISYDVSANVVVITTVAELTSV